MQFPATASTIDSFAQEIMINSSNRLLKKSGRKIKSDEKGQNMEYKPKRFRSTKDMTRDLGSAITMHLRIACKDICTSVIIIQQFNRPNRVT